MKTLVGQGLLAAAVTLLNGCSDGGVQSDPSLSPVHPDRGRSVMSPNAKNGKALLYIGDDATNDVYVYDYKSGNPVGTLTGFDGPYGECVDAKGDIYVANFDSGTVVEYAHGGATPIQTYSPGGTPIGCSVDAEGDVAATSFDPGQVTVYLKGNPSKGTTYNDMACQYFWTMGYDDKGNLVGAGETSSGSPEYCALLAGAKRMALLSTHSSSARRTRSSAASKATRSSVPICGASMRVPAKWITGTILKGDCPMVTLVRPLPTPMVQP